MTTPKPNMLNTYTLPIVDLVEIMYRARAAPKTGSYLTHHEKREFLENEGFAFNQGRVANIDFVEIGYPE